MRLWQFWWQTIILYSQSHPFRFVEVVMLSLAMGLLAIWGITEQWPYLVLSLSYVVGASISVLIREAFFPSSPLRLPQLTAILLLVLSIYSLFDFTRYF